MSFFTTIFGDPNKKIIDKLQAKVSRINELESTFESFSFEELKGMLEGPAGELPRDPGIQGPVPEMVSKWLNYPDPLGVKGEE